MAYEDYGISRDDALKLIEKHIGNENLIKHCLASEAVMLHLARHFGENSDKWGLAGLLHDLDVESQPDLTTHTTETVEILKELQLDEEIIEAIALHNLVAHPGKQRSTPFQHALAAGETITGLIIATTLVYPDKKLASVKVKSVKKRMKEKAFARGANREIIRECELAGIELPNFCELCLQAMQGISDQLGL